MRIGLIEGDPELTDRVRDVLGRGHDVLATWVGEARRQDPLAPSLDLVVIVWPVDGLGRPGAAALVSGMVGARSLAVLPHELVADRLGLVDAGVEYLAHPFHPVELVRRVELLGNGAGAWHRCCGSATRCSTRVRDVWSATGTRST